MTALRRTAQFLLALLLTTSLVVPVAATLAAPDPFTFALAAGPLVVLVALPAAFWLTVHDVDPQRLWETLVVFTAANLLAALFAVTVLTALGVTGELRDVALLAVVYALTYRFGWERGWRRLRPGD